jgi:hypothetical protein
LHREDLRNRGRRVSTASLWPIAAAVFTSWVVVGCLPVAAQGLVSPKSAVCQIIERNAAEHGLPVEYLSRLLWVESGFDANATSPAGATGIAQFMPETAVELGLRDTRDPPASITHAARFLVDLKQRFGNLGLAAAAYNAGPGRLAGWLQGSRGLPDETRHYVQLVTGRPIDQWVGPGTRSEPIGKAQLSCTATIAEFRQNGGFRSAVAWLAPPFKVTADGRFVSRSAARPLTPTARLAVHDLLARAVGVSLRR